MNNDTCPVLWRYFTAIVLVGTAVEVFKLREV